MRSHLSRRSVLTRIAGGGVIAAGAGLGAGAAIAGSRSTSSTTIAKRGASMSQIDSTPTAGSTPAESGYAAVNGLEMYYEIHGAGDPLLMLHGGLSTIGLFVQLLPALAQSRRVIAVEFQGHGHTADIDRPLRYELLADDTIALLRELGIDQTDVFGYSLGGGVALQMAFQQPELIRKLVVASAPFRSDGWQPEILGAMSGLNAEAAAAMTATPMYEAYVSVAPNPDDWPALVTKVGQGVTAETYDWSTEVAAITAPTLLMFGDADSIQLEHIVELFRLLGGGVAGDLAPLPASQLAILPGTAHSALPFRVDLLLPLMMPFLDAPMPEAE
jgi:pimeloyl-ACP methyl ester carboxylesterase